MRDRIGHAATVDRVNRCRVVKPGPGWSRSQGRSASLDIGRRRPRCQPVLKRNDHISATIAELRHSITLRVCHAAVYETRLSAFTAFLGWVAPARNKVRFRCHAGDHRVDHRLPHRHMVGHCCVPRQSPASRKADQQRKHAPHSKRNTAPWFPNSCYPSRLTPYRLKPD